MRAIDKLSAQESSGQWYAAVDAAGQALVALLCGTRVEHVGITKADAYSPWEGYVVYRANSVEQAMRIGLAGEAALLLHRLEDERTVSIWGEHRGLAERLREWNRYWRGFGLQAMLAGLLDENNLDLTIQDAEIAALLALFRCQAYRLLRQEANMNALEALAERLKTVKSLSGTEAECLLGKWINKPFNKSTRTEETSMNEHQVEDEQDKGEAESGGYGFFCPDLIESRQSGILRYTLDVPLDQVERFNAVLREQVFELNPEPVGGGGDDDPLDESSNDTCEEKPDGEREWLGDFNDLEDVTSIQVEVPMRRAWILDRLLDQQPDIVCVHTESVQPEDEED